MPARKKIAPKRLNSAIDLTKEENNIVQISDEEEEVINKRNEQQQQKQKEVIIRLERAQTENNFNEEFTQVASELYTLTKQNENMEKLITQLDTLNIKDPMEEKEKSKIDSLAEKIILESADVVSFNVSGQTFTTTKGTIRREKESFLTVLIDENSHLPFDKDESGAFIIERSALLFSYILKYLQNLDELTGKFDIDVLPLDKSVLNALLDEARFFSLSNLIEVLDKNNSNKMMEGSSSTRLVEVWNYGNTVRNSVVSNEYLKKISERVQKRKSELEQQSKIIKNLVEDQQKKQIESKKTELESRLSKIRQDLGKVDSLTVFFSVSGKIFEMDIFQIFKFKDSLICKLVQKYNRPIQDMKSHPIFIDREPEQFKHIKYFIENECLSEDLLYGRSYNRKSLLREAYFYNITDLVKYLDPVYRFPIEELGTHNVIMKREEDLLRSYFATNRDHPLLNDPYLHLINVFDNLDSFKREPFPDRGNILFKRYPDHVFVESREEFEFNFNCFTKGLFNGMDWNGVIMAGGSVLGCLSSVPASPFGTYQRQAFTQYISSNPDQQRKKIKTDEYIPGSSIERTAKTEANMSLHGDFKASEINMDLLGKSYFYNHVDTHPFANSDIDIFICGLSEEEAELKIRHIYETIKKNTKANVVLIRTSMTVTLQVCEFRPVQIILRLYKSPAEVLMGFDVDCCCFAFDGCEVFCLPRGRRAVVHSVNIVDIDRQSTTYENRLYKYARRGFKACVVGMDTDLIVREGLRRTDSYVTSGRTLDDLIKADFTNSRGLARLLLLDRKSTYIASESDKRVTEDTLIKLDSDQRQKLLFNDWDMESDYLGVLIAFKYRGIPQFFSELLEMLEECFTQSKLIMTVDDIEPIMSIPDQKLAECDLTKRIQWIKIDPGRQFIGSFKPVIDNFFEDCYCTNAELVKRRKEANKPVRVRWYTKSPYFFADFFGIGHEKEIEEAYQNYLKDKSKNTFIYKSPHPMNWSLEPTINFDTMTSDKNRLVRLETPFASHVYPTRKESTTSCYPSPIFEKDNAYTTEIL